MQPSVANFVTSGSFSDQLQGCLKKLEDHISFGNMKYLINGCTALSLVDIAVWATLYVLLAPESSIASEGIYNIH